MLRGPKANPLIATEVVATGAPAAGAGDIDIPGISESAGDGCEEAAAGAAPDWLSLLPQAARAIRPPVAVSAVTAGRIKRMLLMPMNSRPGYTWCELASAPPTSPSRRQLQVALVEVLRVARGVHQQFV